MPTFCRLLLVATLLAISGCSWGGMHHDFQRRSTAFNPGSAEFQRNQAQRFDPYPENNVGPDVVGARPREFQAPPDEATRGRWPTWGWPRFGGPL